MRRLLCANLFAESRSDVEFIIYEDQRLTFDQAYIEASKNRHDPCQRLRYRTRR